MDQFTFALISLFGVPFGIVGLLVLAHRLTPAAVWKSFAVQTVVTLAFLAALALPFAILQIDSQGEYFDDKQALVGEAFALPAGAKVNHQRDRTLRLGDCWRNAVNWRSDVEFASDEAFDRWYGAGAYRDALLGQIAGYYGVSPGAITIADGALDLRERDPAYQLVNHHSAFSQNVRILEFQEPFVCTAIERDGQGRLSLRPCDPIAQPADMGDQGRVILNPSAKERTLEGRIYYASGPSYCTNPVRRAVNNALGLPHPPGGEPNTNIGGILPIL